MAADDLLVFMLQMFTAGNARRPTLVIGAGVAGLQALATAKRLGAVTYAMDIRPAANEQAKSLGARIIETVPKAGGSGRICPETSRRVAAKEREVLAGVLKDMDIVFCSALIPGKVAPILITDKMVESMKNGAVIVDISIDQGGNCEVTPAGKKEIIHNVMVQGIKNIPGLIPTSSTWMFSQNVYNLVKYLSKDGKIELNMNDEIVRLIP